MLMALGQGMGELWPPRWFGELGGAVLLPALLPNVTAVEDGQGAVDRRPPRRFGELGQIMAAVADSVMESMCLSFRLAGEHVPLTGGDPPIGMGEPALQGEILPVDRQAGRGENRPRLPPDPPNLGEAGKAGEGLLLLATYSSVLKKVVLLPGPGERPPERR